MDSKITAEILDELILSLEALEAKNTAILEFLKKEGIASDEKLAPYLKQAATASNIRWLAVRVRMERLLSSAEKESEDKRSKETEAGKQKVESAPARTNEATTTDAELKSKAAGEKKRDNNGSRTRQASGKAAEAASTAEDNDGDRGTNQGTERNGSTHTEKKIA